MHGKNYFSYVVSMFEYLAHDDVRLERLEPLLKRRARALFPDATYSRICFRIGGVLLHGDQQRVGIAL